MSRGKVEVLWWPTCHVGLGIAQNGNISTVAEHYLLWLELFCYVGHLQNTLITDDAWGQLDLKVELFLVVVGR